MLNEFLILAIANAFAVASPGVDFALVLKNTLQVGKSAGIATAIGIGLGILVHMTYTLLGVALVISKSPIIFQGIKILGAIYLLWIVYQSFQSRIKRKETSINNQLIEQSWYISMRQGFIVNILNPKATMFFIAIFTNIISIETPHKIQMLYGFWLIIYAIFWFTFVAWIFSRQQVRNWYLQNGHYIDWAMGVFLLFIALRLVLS
ncbi:MAG: RhtB (resistance to homoserine/threonine) family protein [Polaribacter sp.]|jgi:RhtB (resistance to homoserine/threonine) family protein